MKAVILAAGEGKRLRPLTETMPKVMLPVANKPVLEYVFDAVKNSGIDEIVVVVGYKKEVIMEYFKEYIDVDVIYVVQNKQFGTSHALLQTKKHINEPFIVLSGDNIIDQISISKLIRNESEYSMLVKETLYPSKYGVVTSEKDILKELVEKPPNEKFKRFVSTGIYKLPNSIFDNISNATSQGDYSLSSVIQSTVDQGKKISTILAEVWMDIAYPWDFLRINETMAHSVPSSLGGTIEKGVILKGRVSIGNNTTIYSGCYIIGPVIIGDGCEIGPNVCIFPSTAIGDNSVIHPFSEIRNSVIMNDVHIGSNSFISHSIIGKGSTMGHNFSSMVGKTTMEVEGEFKKLEDIGAIVGADCNIKSHVVIDPGKIIGTRCRIGSMNRIINNISSNSKVM